MVIYRDGVPAHRQSLPSVLWCCWLGLLTGKTHYRVGEPTATWQFVDIVNIDCLTMVDNTSAVGNDSGPWVVPQLINVCQLPRERDGSLQIQSLVEFLISSGHLSPHIGSSWRACHNNNKVTLRDPIWQVTSRSSVVCIRWAILFNL